MCDWRIVARQVAELERERDSAEVAAADELERCRADVMKEIATLQRERSSLAEVVPRSPSRPRETAVFARVSTRVYFLGFFRRNVPGFQRATTVFRAH